MYKQPNARWKRTAMRQKEEESSTLYRGKLAGGLCQPPASVWQIGDQKTHAKHKPDENYPSSISVSFEQEE